MAVESGKAFLVHCGGVSFEAAFLGNARENILEDLKEGLCPEQLDLSVLEPWESPWR